MEANILKPTIAQSIIWACHMLDYTDQVCAGLTGETFDLRPANEAGDYFFSAGEQAMHIVDSRWDMLGWIDGNDYAKRKYNDKYPGKGKPWVFREASAKEVVASLKESRGLLDMIMAGDSTTLLETTAGTVKAYEEQLAETKKAGKDTAELEAGGPSNLVNILLFLVAHEQAHRGVLQTILRMNNVEVMQVA